MTDPYLTSHAVLVRIKFISFWVPATCLSSNTFISEARGQRFKSGVGQIRHSVANGSPPLGHFFKWSCVARRRNNVEMGPSNSLHSSASYWCHASLFSLTKLHEKWNVSNSTSAIFNFIIKHFFYFYWKSFLSNLRLLYSVFFPRILTDLRTNFIKFGLSTTFRPSQR